MSRLHILFACLLGAGFAVAAAVAADQQWHAGPGYRFCELKPTAGASVGFTRLPATRTGIGFTNWLPAARHLTNQVLLNGSGVAAGDVDGDGWCDVYFCRLDGPNALYRNLGGWRFQEVTAAAGVACPALDATGAVLADLDGDGDLDLVVNSMGQGTHLFYNDGHGRFQTFQPPLNVGKGGMSIALSDIDGDGFLDLYVANYRTSALMDMPNTRFWLKVVNGKRVVDKVNGQSASSPRWAHRFRVNDRGGIDELGQPDGLWRNLGGTNFVPLAFTSGRFLDETGKALTEPLFEWGLSVMFRDLNGDGLPDLYVCNDFDSPDRIWLNQGWGAFRALDRLALRKSSLFSMSLDFADLNRDGWDDFVVLDMLNRERVARMTTKSDRKPPIYRPGELTNRPQYMQTVVQLNRGDGTYAEVGQLSGVAACDWAWNVAFLDVDLDGWEDLLVVNGNERDARNMDVANELRQLRTQRRMSPRDILQARARFPSFHTANLAFHNRRDGTFEEVGAQWGFDLVGVSHGLALADLDNDGDLDVVINNLNAPASLLRNNAGAPRVAVRLKGLAPNTRGIGARIWLRGGTLPGQSQEMIAGGRYLSGDDSMRVFAVTPAAEDLRLEVRWRSGRRSRVMGVQANRLYEINEAAAFEIIGPQPAGPIREHPPIFADVSALLGQTHVDAPFNDYQRQPLLPRQLSGLGPGVAWFDLNADGWDDLIIGSGRQGTLGVFLNDGQGGFHPSPEAVFHDVLTRDQAGIVAWRAATNQAYLLTGVSNYEDGATNCRGLFVYDLTRNTREAPLPGSASTTGPLALGDLDGDGGLELFVGGRVLPGRYPAPASSRIFHQVGGQFELDRANTPRLAAIGLVSGAVFSDLDADGSPELILACDWGPIRVWRHEHGRLVEATQQLGLDVYRGWWNGVATGDFDGDGQLDIVASNWGRNTPYEAHRQNPLRLLYGDLDDNGTTDLLEAYSDAALGKLVPERGLRILAAAIPTLYEHWTRHQDYALASVQELFGDQLKRARELQANWLESTLFLNRGDHFEARPLPMPAQVAPAFAVCVADYDNDGFEDVFLSQNFFAVAIGTARYDAGRGLWLRGDGTGGFQAVPGQTSGIKVYGEQRGAALGDYDRDGRVDLVVTQNSTTTRLYKNVGAPRGLRIELAGPPGNPQGIGAALQILRNGKPGPVREVQAGSGYWSQNSLAQVFAPLSAPGQIRVRWPGGKTTVSPAPQNASAVRVATDGRIEVIP